LLRKQFNNQSILTTLHTIAPNNLKPNQVSAPLLIQSFPKISRVRNEAPWWFGRSLSLRENKTNYLAS
jgi:hypothetical protein